MYFIQSARKENKITSSGWILFPEPFVVLSFQGVPDTPLPRCRKACYPA